MDEVILVNEADVAIGSMSKMEAHVKGILHRAFSVFIRNSKGEILIQQRALHKYHSGGLWTNACCSHPKAGETIEQAAKRRLTEELGFTCTVKSHFNFLYKATLDSGLIENELDHVLFGSFDGEFTPNPEEVMAYQWIEPQELINDCLQHPEKYTAWLYIIFNEHLTAFKNALNYENHSN